MPTSKECSFDWKSRLAEWTMGDYSAAWWNGLILFGWGLWLLMPFDTFSTTDSYKILSELASEYGWGLFMCLTSSAMIVGAARRDEWLIMYGSIVAGVSYLLIWASFAGSNWKTTAVWVYLPLSIRCFLLSRKYADKESDHGSQ